jgi:hypothetical protein
MLKVKDRFIADWTSTKELFITHYFPNWESPGWGQFSEVELAGAIGKFSALIADRTLSVKAFELSKQMAKTAAAGLIDGWDDDDGICPPPHPPWWHFGTNLEPQPVPWKEINAAEQVQIAYLLTKFSALTTHAKFNAELKSIAAGIASSVAATLADDFEKCGTLPRPPRRIGVLQE